MPNLQQLALSRVLMLQGLRVACFPHTHRRAAMKSGAADGEPEESLLETAVQ
jgi:uncharacterized protein YjeT (DUF2065 family)